MTWRGRALVDASCLEHIIERQPVRDSLGRDPERPRREQGHLAVSEPRRPASVVHLSGDARIADNSQAAISRPMLEPCQLGQVNDALANRRGGPWKPANLPQSRLRLGEAGGQLRRANERERRRSCRKGKSEIASHVGDISRRS